MSLITVVFPSIFDVIGLMEKYHPRINLRWQLARILVLYLLNLYTLFMALYWKIQSKVRANFPIGYPGIIRETKWMVFQATILHCKATQGRGQPGLVRWILLWIMTWWRIDRSICWPAVQRATEKLTSMCISAQGFIRITLYRKGWGLTKFSV